VTAPDGPAYGPKLPTAAERRSAEALDRKLRKAQMLLSDHGYLSLDRFEVVEILGVGFHRGYYGLPEPAVDMAGNALRPATRP
jgi:hypothetical protein